MSTTTTKGYVLPSNNVRGWWATINSNFQRVNDHTHDNTNSQRIEAKNLTHGTSTISSGSWAATSGQAGTYEQTITVPTGYTMKSVSISFYIASGSEDGNVVFPTVTQVSSTSYKVYTNDNSVDYKAVYA